MERRYMLKAMDAALRAGEKILAIYEDPASDFQIEKKRIILRLPLPTAWRTKQSANAWAIRLSRC